MAIGDTIGVRVCILYATVALASSDLSRVVRTPISTIWFTITIAVISTGLTTSGHFRLTAATSTGTGLARVVGASITGITGRITVTVRLIRVQDGRTVVDRIEDTVAICIYWRQGTAVATDSVSEGCIRTSVSIVAYSVSVGVEL